MAATSIVKLSLESSQYEQKLRGAKRQFEDFTNSIGINMKQLTAAGVAIGIATTAINAFTSACSDAITKSVELAREAEGIKRAFDRIDKPDLLQNLREATHGTVSDLELMKNAVKFDNFNLSLDQMGTFLAFAQQQAKDTGQSVEYMVDSIVTGLGRKSLPILDNLGLSATDIRERMKETGDMTTAVADIIKQRMEAAGGYVETAADRAAQANAELENAMTRLGETMQPLTDSAVSMWNEIKVGALDLLNNALKPIIEAYTEIGKLTSAYNGLGGESKVDRMIKRLGTGTTQGQYSIYTRQLGEFDRYINEKKFQIAAFGGDKSGIAQSSVQKLQTQLAAAEKMRAEYVQRANELRNKSLNPEKETTTTTTTVTIPRGRSLKAAPVDPYAGMFQNENAQIEGLAPNGIIDTSSSLHMGWGLSWRTRYNMMERSKQLESRQGNQNLDEKKDSANLQDITGAVGNMFTCLEQIGIEIPKGFQTAFGIMNTIVSIVAAIQAMQQVGTWLGLFANGGVVHGANGVVPGNHFSGDNIPALLNSGETVLTRSQSSNLLSQLQNGGMGNLQVELVASGEDLKVILNNNGRRTGAGVLMTTNMRRN